VKPEHGDIRADDVAQIWQAAELRRTHDLSGWAKLFFRKRPQVDEPAPISSLPGPIVTGSRAPFLPQFAHRLLRP
jgi:hypothetical protein